MKRVECFECRALVFAETITIKNFYALFVRVMVKFSSRMMKTNLQMNDMMNTVIAMSLAAGLLMMTKSE